MNYHLSQSTGYSLATYLHDNNTVTAYVSVDIHTQQTAVHRATELLYTEVLLSGAGKYSRAQFLDALNLLGARVNLSLSDGVFTLFIRSSADTFKKVLTLVEVMLNAPAFEKTELDRIKRTVINEIKESKEDSKAIAKEALRNCFYGVHDRRYAHLEDTLIETIPHINKQHLKKLHTALLSSPWTCTVGGSKASIALFEASIKRCNTFKAKNHPDAVHQPKPPQAGITMRQIPSRQNIDFSIGAPLPITMHHPDYAPLMFGIAVLGKLGGFTGRLMSTVREAEGLTYGIYATTETFYREEQGYWRIMTFFAPAKAIEGLTSTFREIKKIHTEGITQAELVAFKKIIKTGQVLKNDSTASLLGELHSYHMQQLSLAEIEAFKQRILTVTRKEVNDALKTYLDPRTLTISAAGPVAAIKKELQAFAKNVS